MSITIVCTSQNGFVGKWDQRFGGTDQEHLTTLCQAKDGGFILGGYSLSDSSGDKTQHTRGAYDYWIVKIDSGGNKQWDKRYGGSDYDWLFSVVQTSDDGFILGGRSNSDISGDKTQPAWGTWDYWVVKIDSLGNKQWDKRFGGTLDDWLYSLQQTPDGGYILGGWSDSEISGDKTQAPWGYLGSFDFWIIKIDALGNKLWDRRFGGDGTDGINSISTTTDGGFILGGVSNSGISGDKTQPNWDPALYTSDYWIVKINSVGNTQWDKRFGGTNDDQLFTVEQTKDGGYILGGFSESGNDGDKTQPNWDTTLYPYDYWIVKTDSLGDKQWDKDFGGTDRERFGSISQTSDEGYLIAGTSFSNEGGNKSENNLGLAQTWIVKVDSLGNYQGDKTIFTLGNDEGGHAFQTKDGCYVTANYSSSEIGGYKSQSSRDSSYDYWVMKFCDDSLTSTGNLASHFSTGLSVFPNPFTTFATITLTNYTSPFNVQLFDGLGRQVRLQSYTSQQGSRATLTIGRDALSSGIYFLSITSKEKREVVKLVIE